MEERDARIERNLWTKVIHQAFADALRPPIACKNARHRMRVKDEAMEWITGDGPEFREVCLNAGLEPEWVVRLYEEIKSGKKIVTKLLPVYEMSHE